MEYFGEKNLKDCGICSVCIKSKNKTTTLDQKQLKTQIITLLEHSAKGSRELFELIKTDENSINNCLKELLEQEIITITNTNTYKLKHL